jgi:putative transposase
MSALFWMTPQKGPGCWDFSNINTENSKLIPDQMVDRYGWLLPMRDLIMDHGSEFGAHRVYKDGTWNGCFKNRLGKHGIKPILGSVAHPKTNGKLERFFQEYQRHRAVFHSIDEFINWNDDRPYESQEFERLETPDKAFISIMPQEAFYQ